VWAPSSLKHARRRELQLLAKHRMPAYRQRLLSIIQLSAPQLLPVPSASTAGPLHIELTSDLGDSISLTSAAIRLPLLPPSNRDDLASRPESAQAAASLGSSSTSRSLSRTRWQLPPFIKTAAGWPQDVPATIEVDGACLDTVASAQLESPTGRAWPARITECPALPDLLSVSATWPERTEKPRQTWMQRMLALAMIRRQSGLNDVQPATAPRTQQSLLLAAAVPYTVAEQLVDGPSQLSVRLRSDWAEAAIEVALHLRCVWVISEQPMDALAFMRQLVPSPPVHTDPEATSAANDALRGRPDLLTDVGSQQLSPRPADCQPASAWGTRLRAPVGLLVDLQQRAAGLAAALQPAPPLPCVCSAGVKYAAIMQDQSASFEERVRSLVMALQHRMANDSPGQPSSILRRLQLTRTTGLQQQLDPADAVLVLLQSDRQAGAVPSAQSFWRMRSQPSQLEQLIGVTMTMNVPIMVVLLGSGPWSGTMGTDLTRWARSGASVMQVASFDHNAQGTAAGGLLVQHAMYRMLTRITSAEIPARSKL